MPKFQNLLLFSLLFTLVLSCQPVEKSAAEGSDKLLANVYNNALYLSEMDGMFPENATIEDSSLIINTFVERWVRDKVMMHEAEQNIPKDLNIDKLVRDYRASLVKHNYEKLIVELEQDSVVNEAELFAYYEKNKEQFQLERPIIRCYFIKIAVDRPELDSLKRAWPGTKEENFYNMVDYCSAQAEVFLLSEEVWYTKDDIVKQIPASVLLQGAINSNSNFTKEANGFLYLLKVFEIIEKNKLAPLEYVKDKATKVILHKRKSSVLEGRKEEMYSKALENNHIKIYVE